MSLTDTQKSQIQQTIANCLRNKFQNYEAKDNLMPFHFRLLGKDRMALYLFMQSLLTTFDTSIFEPVAAALAKTQFAKVDLFVENADGEQFLFDLKTAKPNKGDFQKYKQTLLEWAGIAYTVNKNAKIHTLIAIPYNPYEPQPYQFWTLAGMLDLQEELMVAERFWDFLGGEGAYIELLDCFERAGIELRPEIDEYFAKFNR